MQICESHPNFPRGRHITRQGGYRIREMIRLNHSSLKSPPPFFMPANATTAHWHSSMRNSWSAFSMSIFLPLRMKATSRWPPFRLLSLFSNLHAQWWSKNCKDLPKPVDYWMFFCISLLVLFSQLIATLCVPCHSGHHQPDWMELT